MSHNEENLDLFLRKTLEAKTFEQKPHYWEGAKQLIDNHRKQRNRNVLLYSVSVALVAVTAAAWMLVSYPSESSSSTAELAFAPVNPQQTNPNTTNTEQGQPAPFVAQSSSSAATENPSVVDQNNNQPEAASANNITTPAKRNPPAAKNNSKTDYSNASNPVVAIAYTTQEPENIDFRKLTNLPKYTQGIPSDTFSRKQFEQAYTQRKQQQLWLVEAGLNSYNGLSINLHGGVRYMRFINEKVALSVGASYAQLHQDMNRTYQSIDYSFGQQVQETTINTQRVDYIELPIAVHYSFTANHLLNIGVIPAYAIHTSDKVTYSLGETSSTQNLTYPDAVNRFDLQLQAGYTYRFNETWMVSAGYQFGLLDVSNNNVFKSTNFDRNKGLRLTLGYKLF